MERAYLAIKKLHIRYNYAEIRDKSGLRGINRSWSTEQTDKERQPVWGSEMMNSSLSNLNARNLNWGLA